ncbi:MAG TPA: hypothetical protein VIQ78_01015 [Terrimesophilobacter sp.]|jgi:hypothetical protein|uniref:hypothetical protein n=1 Tax=Terrimesophilobacter sp. TaxID=2906435 RepID=UPI002F93F5E1
MLESADSFDPEAQELVAPWAPVPALGSPAEDALACELTAVLQSWLRDQLAASRPPDIPPVTPISDHESLDTAG